MGQGRRAMPGDDNGTGNRNMAIHKITPANSIIQAAGNAITDTDGGTLTVDPGAWVLTLPASGGYGAYIGGFSSVTINGAIGSYGGGYAAIQAFPITPANVVTVKVGADGVIFNGGGGVAFGSTQVFNITNLGLIAGGYAIDSSASGNHTITNSGEISSTAGNTIGFSGAGVQTITNTGTITAPDGGFARAISNSGAGSSVKLTNKGVIDGDVILSSGADIVTLSAGLMDGDVETYGGADTMTIASTIFGSVNLGDDGDKVTQTGGSLTNVLLGAGADTFTLSKGRVYSGVYGEDGADIFTISGGETYFISGGADADQLKLSNGVIESDIDLGKGADIVSISGGSVGADVALGADDDQFTMTKGAIGDEVVLGSGADSFTMKGGSIGYGVGFDETDTLADTFVLSGGAISNGVSLGAGDDHVTISGGSVGGWFDLGGGGDTFTMSNGYLLGLDLGEGNNVATVSGGSIHAGVYAGSGNDSLTVTLKSGELGWIELGDGADTFVGGAIAEDLTDGGGSDVASFGAGADTYHAVKNGGAADGVDDIDGGVGVDLYDAGSAAADVNVNLDIVDHDGRTALTANGADTGLDMIDNFENVNTGEGNDYIYGNAAANVLRSNDGADTLTGGLGADTLWGGADADVFVYKAVNETGVTAKTRDVIMDFEVGVDKIDLTAIDAISTNLGSDAFDFKGVAAFSKTAGELIQTLTAGGAIISGDVNGDGKGDFSIQIKGVTAMLTAGDFV